MKKLMGLIYQDPKPLLLFNKKKTKVLHEHFWQFLFYRFNHSTIGKIFSRHFSHTRFKMLNFQTIQIQQNSQPNSWKWHWQSSTCFSFCNFICGTRLKNAIDREKSYLLYKDNEILLKIIFFGPGCLINPKFLWNMFVRDNCVWKLRLTLER